MYQHYKWYRYRKDDPGTWWYVYISCMLLLCLMICSCEKKPDAVVKKKKKPVEKSEVFIPRGTVTIGLNLPLTGPYADQGKDELRAFNLALEELNRKKGILGMRVEKVVLDTQSKPEVAAKNAEVLIEQHGVVMITGGVSSAVAIAVSKVCQRQKMIFMATVTHSDATTGSEAHRHIFRKCTSATMDARALASILAKYYAHGTTYFFITADYTWGRTTESAISKILDSAGAKTVGIVRTPLGTTDFTKALEKASKAKPDGLVLVLFGDDLVHAIKQLTAKGMKDSLKIVVVPYIELNMALKAGPEAISGIIATAPWYWGLSDMFKKAKIFVDAFHQKYGRKPSNCAESAYMDIMEYAQAVERAGTFNADQVIKSLEGHKFTGLKDPEFWRSWDHQCIQTVFLLKGKKPENMRNKYDFFVILHRIDGNAVARNKTENPVVLEPLK